MGFKSKTCLVLLLMCCCDRTEPNYRKPVPLNTVRFKDWELQFFEQCLIHGAAHKYQRASSTKYYCFNVLEIMRRVR